ncbi:MAG: VCBS repeat-containing protein, partial [Bacteroidales bacterium]|nr:VCBS repeat-containing protein [Bacteroidales bacterium]
MKRLQVICFIAAICGCVLRGQEIDLILDGPESGNKTHEARNSITLAPGYSYTPSGGTMTAYIVDPIVTGNVSYAYTPVDPETRTLSTSYMVGATSGIFSVNPMGGASYSIPLKSLPGVNGLTPLVSLVYSSHSGPGIAGYGWQVTGISAISRSPQTMYHDGVTGEVGLNYSDRFSIDGQRLITTYGNYGYNGATYQTENDVFTRVISEGTSGYGPLKFKAETKSGLKYEYGYTVNSRQKISGNDGVLTWYMSKISDLFGNDIVFNYLQDNSYVYPAEIIYGPNKIFFYYKEINYIPYFYFKGSKIEQRYILDKITVSYNGNILKTYQCKYNCKGDYYNQNYILNELIEYGTGTNRLNSTAFIYEIPDNVSFSQDTYNTTHSYVTYKSRVFTGDFNGDGKADAFCLPDPGKGASWTGWKLFKNAGEDYFGLWLTGNFSIDEGHIIDIAIMDLNGDHYKDMLFVVADNMPGEGIPFIPSAHFYYAICNETSVSDVQSINELAFSTLPVDFINKYADFDGDGLNDCFIVTKNGNWYRYSYSYSGGQLYSLGLRNSGNFGTSFGDYDKINLGDFNGDGKTDVWIFNATGLKIYTLTGSTQSLLYNSTSITRNYYFTLGDYNGDGKSDIFAYAHKSGSTIYDWANWQVRQSTGTGFEIYSFTKKKSNLYNDRIRSGDFNGDGCTDLMVTASSDGGWSGHYYYISKNKGSDLYSHYYSSGQAASHNYYIEDYDGDGRHDYLCTDGVSPWWNGYMIYRAPGNTRTLMSKAGNGLGNLTKISYSKLSAVPSSIYQKGSGASFPVSDFQGPVTVVDSLWYDNGNGVMNLNTYYYEGFKIHRQGKGFLGYTKTRITDEASDISSENTYGYNTTYFYPRLISSARKYASQDPFELTENTWAHIVLDATKKRIFPYVQTSVQQNQLTGHVVSVTTSYDNYGNPLCVLKNYKNGVTETATHTYNNTVSSSQWLIGRSTSSTVQYADSDTTFSRSVSRTFSSSNNSLFSETSLPGTSMELIHRFQYNANGTLQRDSTGYGTLWRTTSYTYETDGVRRKTITGPLLHTTFYTYDNLGRLSTEKDYLNNTVTYGYDALGRNTSVSSTDGSQHTTSYAWTGTGKPTLGVYRITTSGNDGSELTAWYDELQREIRSDVKGFDATMIFSLTEYNTKGQLSKVSEPYFYGGTALWNEY